MTAEDLPKFELGTNHVVVPLSFFNQVMEVYHHHTANRLIKDPAPPLQSPASQRIEIDMNLKDMEFQSRGVPPGYVPKGAAAKKVESED